MRVLPNEMRPLNSPRNNKCCLKTTSLERRGNPRGRKIKFYSGLRKHSLDL